jgi:large subunit ribosomal protein L29
MKYNEIKDLTVDELRKREKGIRQEATDLRLKHSLGQITNPLQIRAARRDLARVKTALSAKLRG